MNDSLTPGQGPLDQAYLESLALEAARRRSRVDAAAFARFTHLEPDPWQERVLRSTSKRVLLNCCRQSGKSTVLSVLALHTCIYHPKSTVLIFCPAERQSKELILKVQERLAYLPVKISLEGENKTEILFGNKSRIISLPATESTVRTYAADLIIEDEAGDVPDELYQAVIPMLLVKRGRFILSGTLKGRRGHFFDAWDDNRRAASWERYEVPYTEVPRFTPEAVEELRRELLDRFPQEMECKFINAGSGLVYGAYDGLVNLISKLPTPKGSHKGWTYMLGLDFGYNDDCAFVVIGYLPNDPTVYVIESFKETELTPSECGKRVGEIMATRAISRIIGDVGGLGKGYAEEIKRRFHIPIEPALKQNKRGYIDLLNGDLKSGNIKIVEASNQELLKEMTNLPWNEDRTKEHPGFPNHLTDGFLYVWRDCTTYLQKKNDAPELTEAEQIRKRTEAFWKKAADDAEQRRLERMEVEEAQFGMVYDRDDPFKEI